MIKARFPLPELTARLVETRARQHGPCWRAIETGYRQLGPLSRVVETGL